MAIKMIAQRHTLAITSLSKALYCCILRVSFSSACTLLSTVVLETRGTPC